MLGLTNNTGGSETALSGLYEICLKCTGAPAMIALHGRIIIQIAVQSDDALPQQAGRPRQMDAQPLSALASWSRQWVNRNPAPTSHISGLTSHYRDQSSHHYALGLATVSTV